MAFMLNMLPQAFMSYVMNYGEALKAIRDAGLARVAELGDSADYVTKLLILHDWSGFILLEDDAIDRERKVIHEEWRTRSNATLRMYDSLLPKLYPNGNRYASRMPIGLMEVVDNFPYEVLRNYYRKWYRPDLQAIVVVGDIDVDSVEARIKTMWQDIPRHKRAAERKYFPVEDNAEPIAAIAPIRKRPLRRWPFSTNTTS